MQDVKELRDLDLPELRFRRSYIKERLIELKLEREHLISERDRVRDELLARGIGQKRQDETSPDFVENGLSA